MQLPLKCVPLIAVLMYKRDDGSASHASMSVYGLPCEEFRKLCREYFINFHGILLKTEKSQVRDYTPCHQRRHIFIVVDGIY